MLHSRLESPPNTPLLSEASSAESGDDSQVSPTSPLSESEYGEYSVSSYGPAPPLPSELPDLNQSKHDLDQSIDLNNVKDTNIDAILLLFMPRGRFTSHSGTCDWPYSD